MEYFDYCEKTRQALQDYMGDEAEVFIKDVVKNNGLILKGIVVHKKECKVSPTVYLEQFYKQYTEGTTFAENMREIIRLFEECRDTRIDVEYYKHYEMVKDKIVYKLINYEMNETLLQDVPHIRWNDLAIVFCHLIDSESIDNASILIRNDHALMWGVSVTELREAAEANTPEVCGDELVDLRKLLPQLVAMTECEYMDYSSLEMFILSNTKRTFGATSILYSDKIRLMAEEYGCGIYVIPSSIHEVILLPERPEYNSVYIRQMIRDVNDTQLDLEERLSNNLYYYDNESGKISIVGTDDYDEFDGMSEGLAL